MQRYLRLIAFLLIIFTALFVFPNRIPEFAGLWLLWCSVRMVQGKGARFELLAIPLWLLIKWPEPGLALGVFVVAVFRGSMVSQTTSGFPRHKYLLIFLWATWAGWFVHDYVGAVSFRNSGNDSGPIVCLGDSLTDFGYPDELKKLTDRPIADFGFNGYTTVDALKLMPEIERLKPDTVVIEIGGHDFNTGKSRAATEENMRELILLCHGCGAKVILVEIPRGFINDPWYGFERQLARKYDLDLVPDTMIRRLAFWSPIFPPGSLVADSMRLSKDGLHPNESGNRMMAKTIAGYLER